MADVVVLGDPFAGEIKVGSKKYNIQGTWVSTPQSVATANGKLIVVEGAIGEYNCPACNNAKEQVQALSSSNLKGVQGLKIHRVGDSVKVLSHENVSVVSTKGQSNVTAT